MRQSIFCSQWRENLPEIPSNDQIRLEKTYVLAVLIRGDAYGYALTAQVKEVLDISESTLYPVLRRLQAEGCLSAYNRAYRNRRYYAITEAGRVRLAENRALWRVYCEGVDWLLREEAKNGEA